MSVVFINSFFVWPEIRNIRVVAVCTIETLKFSDVMFLDVIC